MNINLSIYKNHDEDLLAVYSIVGGRQFGLYVRDVLTAYARGDKAQLKFPDISSVTKNTLNKSIRLHIAINESKFPTELSIIKDVRPSCLQMFIKCLLRSYHAQELLTFYMNGNANVRQISLEQNTVTSQNNLIAGLLAALGGQINAAPAVQQPVVTATDAVQVVNVEMPAEANEMEKEEEIRKQSESDMAALADMFGL